MISWAVWVSFAAVSVVNIVTPGPANLNTLHRAVELGPRRVIPGIAGNALGLAVAGGFCAIGLLAAVQTTQWMWDAVQWFGPIYLAWLGGKLVWRGGTVPSLDEGNARVGGRVLFVEAFLIAIGNPKALLFFAALFPQSLDQSRMIATQVAVLVTTYCVLSIVSLSLYAASAEFLRRSINSRAIYSGFRKVSGLLMIAFSGILLCNLV